MKRVEYAGSVHDEEEVEAVDVDLTAPYLTPPQIQGRALVGAASSLVALGDRTAAEAIYRRLVESSGEEPEILTQASKLFGPGRRR